MRLCLPPSISGMGTVSTPRSLTSLSIVYIGFSLDDSYTSTFASESNSWFGAHNTSKLLFPTIRGSPNRTITLNTSVQTFLPLENVLSLLGCFLSSKGTLTVIPYVRGHIRSLINSGLCPYITAPLRTAATASLGQITFNLGNSDFTLSYKSGESENPPTIKIVPITPLCLLFLTNMSFTWAIMESVVCLKNCFIISGLNRSFSLATLTVWE